VLTVLLICTEHGPSEEDGVIGAAHGTNTTSRICDTITATEQQHVPFLHPSPSHGCSSSTALQALPIKERLTRGYDSGLGTRFQERMAKPPVLLYQVALHFDSPRKLLQQKLGRLGCRDDSDTRVRLCFPPAFLRPPARIATVNSMTLRLL
ncbi:hypothetical protein HPB47_004939, partial [Ixodes persulcatus]